MEVSSRIILQLTYILLGFHGYTHGRGHGGKKRGRGSQKAMRVRYKASMRERAERGECRLWGLGERRDGEKPQVRRGILGAGEEGESGGGRVEQGDRGRCENG
jgi:hypothetical protein